VARNFNCLVKNKEFVKVMCSRLHCKCGIILVTVQDGVVITDDWKESDRFLSNSRNPDDLEWPSRSFTYCKPFKCEFSNSEAAADKISTNSASHSPSATAELLEYFVKAD